jgi:hypothetical protein
VGSVVGLEARIRRMMRVMGDQPVLWITVKSLLDTGPYSEKNMRHWNRTVVDACAKYPNIRVFDWASLAEESWYISDGTHFTSQGYRHRARLSADALAHAYVRADNIVALVPIDEDRGSGRRTLVYVDGLPEPLVAGRTEGTILRDMVGAESGAAELLRELQLQIGQVRPLLKSSIRSEAGLDLDELSRRITDLTGEQASPKMF